MTSGSIIFSKNENPPEIFSNTQFVWKFAKQPPSSQRTNKVENSGFKETRLFDVTLQASYSDEWNAFHVKMPCSHRNTFLKDGKSIKRWSLIEKALQSTISSVEDFTEAVLSYNNSTEASWNFEHLSAAIDMNPTFIHLLQKIAKLALRLPELIPKPIPLLLRNKEGSVTMSQEQAACLLANAFYCTFPYRNTRSDKSSSAQFPAFNFGAFMSTGFRNRTKSTDHKVYCILHYFNRFFAGDSPQTGVVTFTRRCLYKPPNFDSSDATFDSINFGVSSTCFIEDAHPETIQVNFANRYLGGGVLRGGCVQEEILCCIRPEILVGLLIFEAMEDHEALIIEGAERFSRYTGYSSAFKWAGDFNEARDARNTRDEEGRWKGVIVAIDAMPCRHGRPQFKIDSIHRELIKAYCGFTDEIAPYRVLPNVVVSGNWGCGAFGGNKELKCLIQLMACAQAGKSLVYCTFADKDLEDRILKMFEALCSNSCTVGQLWNILAQIDTTKMQSKTSGVFDYVIDKLSSSKSTA